MDKSGVVAAIAAALLAGAGAVYVTLQETSTEVTSVTERLPIFHRWMDERGKQVDGNTHRIERLESLHLDDD